MEEITKEKLDRSGYINMYISRTQKDCKGIKRDNQQLSAWVAIELAVGQ